MNRSELNGAQAENTTAMQDGRRVLPHFVILTLGRAGSSHLVSLLDSHPELACFNELFRPADASAAPYFYGYTSFTDPHEYMAFVAKLTTKSFIGFKLARNCLNTHPEAERLLDNPRVRVIFLKRANLLAQAVSGGLAKATGVWHSTVGTRDPKAQVHLPPQNIVQMLRGFQMRQSALAALCEGHPLLELDYEALAAGNCVGDVQRFLDVEPQLLVSKHHRLDPRPLHEKIVNAKEIMQVLAGTEFEGLL